MKTYKPYRIEDILTPEQLIIRKERLKFKAEIDKMYKDKYPETDFCLDTDSEEVKSAYKRLIAGKSVDFR